MGRPTCIEPCKITEYLGKIHEILEELYDLGVRFPEGYIVLRICIPGSENAWYELKELLDQPDPYTCVKENYGEMRDLIAEKLKELVSLGVELPRVIKIAVCDVIPGSYREVIVPIENNEK